MRRALTLIAICLGCGSCGGDNEQGLSDDNVVNVYNWADYIGETTIERFEAEYGIKVNYDVFDAN